MGRMKEVYMQIMQANDGIPEDLTIADIAVMEQMKIYQWQDYEREREKRSWANSQSENSTEARKVEQVRQKFKRDYVKNN
jgi:hypothetical protein